MILKRGDGPCSVMKIAEDPDFTPLQIALDAAEIKTTHGEQISLEDQTRGDVVFVTSEQIPNISGDLNVCQNYSAGTMLPISSEQFNSLESGNIIFVEDPKTMVN